MSSAQPSRTARLLKSVATAEPHEVRAVIWSMLYFLFLFGSYSVVMPVRDAMATVHGVRYLQELFTATLVASFVFAPLYSGLASRIRLSSFLPWVYGFVALTLLLFTPSSSRAASGPPDSGRVRGYKTKNVIDTVVYRFGDFSSAWVSSAILPLGSRGFRSSVRLFPRSGFRSPICWVSNTTMPAWASRCEEWTGLRAV